MKPKRYPFACKDEDRCSVRRTTLNEIVAVAVPTSYQNLLPSSLGQRPTAGTERLVVLASRSNVLFATAPAPYHAAIQSTLLGIAVAAKAEHPRAMHALIDVLC